MPRSASAHAFWHATGLPPGEVQNLAHPPGQREDYLQTIHHIRLVAGVGHRVPDPDGAARDGLGVGHQAQASAVLSASTRARRSPCSGSSGQGRAAACSAATSPGSRPPAGTGPRPTPRAATQAAGKGLARHGPSESATSHGPESPASPPAVPSREPLPEDPRWNTGAWDTGRTLSPTVIQAPISGRAGRFVMGNYGLGWDLASDGWLRPVSWFSARSSRWTQPSAAQSLLFRCRARPAEIGEDLGQRIGGQTAPS